MLDTDTSSTASTTHTRKHHRIHPIPEHNPSTNDTHGKAHTIVNMTSIDDDRLSLQRLHQRSNSQTSTTSSTMDARATDVIKRITNPSGTVSNTDEILPQTLFRRMSASFNMNSFGSATTLNSNPAPSIQSPTAVLPAIHDLPSSMTNDEDYLHSVLTVVSSNTINASNECEICCSSDDCERLQMCSHHFCHKCLQVYLTDKIRQGCSALLECPHDGCQKIVHPQDVGRILNDPQMYQRYETFMLRRILQKMPDTRWCP